MHSVTSNKRVFVCLGNCESCASEESGCLMLEIYGSDATIDDHINSLKNKITPAFVASEISPDLADIVHSFQRAGNIGKTFSRQDVYYAIWDTFFFELEADMGVTEEVLCRKKSLHDLIASAVAELAEHVCIVMEGKCENDCEDCLPEVFDVCYEMAEGWKNMPKILH